jgi:hypothetical protein
MSNMLLMTSVVLEQVAFYSLNLTCASSVRTRARSYFIGSFFILIKHHLSSDFSKCSRYGWYIIACTYFALNRIRNFLTIECETCRHGYIWDVYSREVDNDNAEANRNKMYLKLWGLLAAISRISETNPIRVIILADLFCFHEILKQFTFLKKWIKPSEKLQKYFAWKLNNVTTLSINVLFLYYTTT